MVKSKFNLLLIIFIIFIFITTLFFINNKSSNQQIYQVHVASDDFMLENYTIVKTSKSYYVSNNYSIKALGDYTKLSDISFSVKCEDEYLTTSWFNFPNSNIFTSEAYSLNNNYSINNKDTLLISFKYKKNNESKEVFHTIKLDKFKAN